MQNSEAPTSERPEDLIAGRYRVHELLGQGGMGAVYAVLDGASGKRLALKRLAKDASPATAALFEREYHTLSGLKHPSIVEVYDYGRDSEGVFYTMELIVGHDLSKLAPMPWRVVCKALRDAASILGLLHARRLIHRDLSPRNLMRTASGGLKLIDFGALAPFGPSSELVGTPPFVAPEALRALPLDQRTDLFALGALGYWLLTGVHAFPARSLRELPMLWEREPAAPSTLLAMLASGVLEPIPAELDALIAALLRVEPGERMDSTAELIDRLNAVADLEPEELSIQGYLDSKAFVGRAREADRARSLLHEAGVHKHVQTLLVEGDAGVGRTRFLEELEIVLRLAGALPVSAGKDAAVQPYGVGETLLLGLLRVLPEPTRQAVAPHAVLLGSISQELRTALRVTPRPSQSQAHAPAELRVRLLSALSEVLLDVSREHLLVLIVDDVQAIDEESRALLATLAHAEGPHQLLIVSAAGHEAKRDGSAALSSLRERATRVRLLPLSAGETLDLLRSVFGQVRYLERLAERLHRASEGNPAYCLELARHLVQTGVATYQDGSWSLPADLASDSLPESRLAGQVARLERLTVDARKLARSMSVPHDAVLHLAHCIAVAGQPPDRVHELLAELIEEGVLRAVPSGYRFSHGQVQAALYAELDAPGRRRAHFALGCTVAAATDVGPLETVRASVHFLRADNLERGYEQLRAFMIYFESGDMSPLQTTATLLEEAHSLLREQRQDKYGVVGVLCLLAISGYFADRVYADRYAELAMATSHDVLRLGLARRLERYLGAKLGLVIALLIAGVSLALRRRRAPPLDTLVRLSLGAGAALAGVAAICVDPKRAAKYAAQMRPFSVLGPDHGANITYRFADVAALTVSNRLADARTQTEDFLARLQSRVPLRDLPDGVKENYIAGCIAMLGVIESRQDGSRCLELADQLERFSPVYSMNADQIRAGYYANQGELERARHFQQRMEVHAVQLGSAWQAETWSPATDSIITGLRLEDAALTKRAAQELARLRAKVPSMIYQEQRARGTYLILRNRHAEALRVLESLPTEPELIGTANLAGLIARAYNGLHQHERARSVCLAGLSTLDAGDLMFASINLNVQIELALAEVGLGHFDVAQAQLEKLFAQHAPQRSPVTLGSLHEASARLALATHDLPRAREHLNRMDAYYRSTGVATLAERVARLRGEVERTGGALASDFPRGDDALVRGRHELMRVQLTLDMNDSATVNERAQKGLQVALELSSADEGFIVLAESLGAPAAHLGSGLPSSELVLWAEQRMHAASFDEQTMMTAQVDSDLDSNYRVEGEIRYCAVPLWAYQRNEDRVVAALVLGFHDRVPRMPDPAAMRAIAIHLAGTKQTV